MIGAMAMPQMTTYNGMTLAPMTMPVFQHAVLVPVAMVVNVPSCSSPVPSVASSETSEGLSRQSTADSSELSMVSQVSISSISSISSASVPEIQNIAGCVWDLSQRSKGCRLVQQALDAASDTERTNLAQELKGHVLASSRSACANYVLQKFIQVLRPQNCQFIVDELMEEPMEVCNLARHQYGCRILQRLFENCQAEQMEGLVQLLLSEALNLARHSYGTYVMQQIFDFGTEMQRHRLGEALLAAGTLFNDEHATQVLQKALQHAPQQVALAQCMIPQLANMARGRHSHQTVLAALQLLPSQEYERAIALLCQKVKKLWASRYGRLVVKSIPALYQQCSSLTRREAAGTA